MNDRSFEIEQMTESEAKLRNLIAEQEGRINQDGRWLPLTDNDALKLDGMNRAQRRAWLKQQRKGGKL